MSATLLYRIAGFVFALFALGHTYGFLGLRAPSVEGRAVSDGSKPDENPPFRRSKIPHP
jgi:hypothetical protein